MFEVRWSGVAVGESVVDLTLCHSRNNENDELTGMYVDDGLIVVSPTGVLEQRPPSWSVIKSGYR
jgi:hypothetical protein